MPDLAVTKYSLEVRSMPFARTHKVATGRKQMWLQCFLIARLNLFSFS